jgi:hypothetical protein
MLQIRAKIIVQRLFLLGLILLTQQIKLPFLLANFLLPGLAAMLTSTLVKTTVFMILVANLYMTSAALP